MAFRKEFLRDRRVYCGFSQEEFAKRVGVCKQAVQKWESGEVVPRSTRLQRISEVLNTRIAELSDVHVTGNNNCIASNNNNFLSAAGSDSVIELFRSGLIEEFIDSNLPPDALKIALQIVKNYKREKQDEKH